MIKRFTRTPMLCVAIFALIFNADITQAQMNCAQKTCAFLPAIYAPEPFQLTTVQLARPRSRGSYIIMGELINTSSQTYSNLKMAGHLYSLDVDLGVVTGTVLSSVLVPGQAAPFLIDQGDAFFDPRGIYQFTVSSLGWTRQPSNTHILLDSSIQSIDKTAEDGPEPPFYYRVVFLVKNNSTQPVFNTQLSWWATTGANAYANEFGPITYTLGTLAVGITTTVVLSGPWQFEPTRDNVRLTALGNALP